MRTSAVPSPYPDGGHTRIADELLDALIGYPLSKRQYKVVLAVIRKTYGYGKTEDDLSSTQLAGLTGLADSHCRAAVRELAALGVLRVNPGRYGQRLAINPDHRTWAYPDRADQNGPAAGPKQSGADQNSPTTRTKTVRSGGPKRSTQKTTSIDNPNTPLNPPSGGTLGEGDGCGDCDCRDGRSARSVSRRAGTGVEEDPLPDGVPPDLWAEFLEHRRAIKSPMTTAAKQRAFAALARMAGQGQDPAAILEQSIVNGWRGLFAVKATGPPAGRAGAGFAQQRMANTVQSLQAIFGETDGQGDLSAGHGLPGGGLRRGAHAPAGSGLLGPARRAAR